jgi:UDP-N-acetylmuramoyl-tripeptide--D-alanyl-D-alanine ligase
MMVAQAPLLAWTLADVAGATGGELAGDATALVSSVVTDSRKVQPGELFVAIRGESFDGHDFAHDAMRAGAAAVLVERGFASDLAPRIDVADTSTGLRDLAVHRRRQLDAPVAAITGSTGKTSTKDLLAAALPGSWASPLSFNNEVGVPLTVLGTPPHATHLVIEVGSRGRGDIAWLAPAVKPDVSVIVNLGVVHLETFGTPETLADAKWELVEALDGGTAVLPFDEPRLRRAHDGPVVTFGEDRRADVAGEDIELDTAGRPSLTLRTDRGSVRVRLPLSGMHQAINATAATAAALALGASLDGVAEGLEGASGSPWRMEVHRGRFTVVNDAYNANPDSVAGALRTVSAMPGRPIAVLGRMAELGDISVAEHERIGSLAEELGFALVVVVGEDDGLAAGAGKIAVSVADEEGAMEILAAQLRNDDVVLVKASRAIGLETLATRLAAEAVT